MALLYKSTTATAMATARPAFFNKQTGFLLPLTLPAVAGTLTLTLTLALAPGARRGAQDVVCMAHPRRVQMVAKQIRRELGEMLIRDKVLQHAVLPETSLGADMYLSSVTTISDVELSNDMQVCKVYVSVYGDNKGKEMVMEGLKAKTKYVRANLGKRMSLRMTPEVRFILDDSLERGTRVIAILDKLRKEREQEEQIAKSKNSDDDNVNWDDILEDDEEEDED